MRHYFFKFIYLFWKRETEGTSWGWEERGKRESQACSALSAQSPMRASNSCTTRSWPELKPSVRGLTNWAPQVPPNVRHFYCEQKAWVLLLQDIVHYYLLSNYYMLSFVLHALPQWIITKLCTFFFFFFPSVLQTKTWRPREVKFLTGVAPLLSDTANI